MQDDQTFDKKAMLWGIALSFLTLWILCWAMYESTLDHMRKKHPKITEIASV